VWLYHKGLRSGGRQVEPSTEQLEMGGGKASCNITTWMASNRRQVTKPCKILEKHYNTHFIIEKNEGSNNTDLSLKQVQIPYLLALCSVF
jgi:uncharacterized protein Veg